MAASGAPASLSKLPGCGFASVVWKLYPVLQSQKLTLPLSPPETRTLSRFTDIALMIALWPEKFVRNSPRGNFHFCTIAEAANSQYATEPYLEKVQKVPNCQEGQRDEEDEEVKVKKGEKDETTKSKKDKRGREGRRKDQPSRV